MKSSIVSPLIWKPLSLKFQDNKGYKFYRQLKSFQSSFSTFNLNYYELRSVANGEEYLSLFDIRDLRRWKLQNILSKNVFNTVTSALAFLDHIKLNVRDNAVLREIIKDDIEIHCFYRSLRNYLVHRNTFDLTSRSKSDGISTIDKVYHTFDTRNFEEYLKSRKTNYDDNSLIYLKRLNEKEDFLKLLEGLKEWINFVHHSVIVEFVKMHSKYLKEFNDSAISVYNLHGIYYPINAVQIRHLTILLSIAGRHSQGDTDMRSNDEKLNLRGQNF